MVIDPWMPSSAIESLPFPRLLFPVRISCLRQLLLPRNVKLRAFFFSFARFASCRPVVTWHNKMAPCMIILITKTIVLLYCNANYYDPNTSILLSRFYIVLQCFSQLSCMLAFPPVNLELNYPTRKKLCVNVMGSFCIPIHWRPQLTSPKFLHVTNPSCCIVFVLEWISSLQRDLYVLVNRSYR